MNTQLLITSYLEGKLSHREEQQLRTMLEEKSVLSLEEQTVLAMLPNLPCSRTKRGGAKKDVRPTTLTSAIPPLPQKWNRLHRNLHASGVRVPSGGALLPPAWVCS